jgi:hypothetical protein
MSKIGKIEKIQFCIDPDDNIYVTVEDIDIHESGCGQCQQRYNVFSICGSIKANYLEKNILIVPIYI